MVRNLAVLIFLLSGALRADPLSHAVSAYDLKLLCSLKPPLLHPVVTSPFGFRLNPVRRTRAFHAGVDYGAPVGTPVYAAQSGTVEAVGLSDRSGIYLRIRHSRGLETVYAHLHRVMPGLKPGSYLRGGDILGFVGSSGFATGPHLHYEILLGGTPIDPTGDRAAGRNLALLDTPRSPD